MVVTPTVFMLLVIPVSSISAVPKFEDLQLRSHWPNNAILNSKNVEAFYEIRLVLMI
jgi:hypothetical protein